MRKVLILAASLVLCAGSLAAQQRDVVPPAQPGDDRPAVSSTATRVETPVGAPSLHVSTEEIRSRVQRTGEARRREDDSQLGSRSWWYLVAAIAIGVVVALIVAD